MEGINCPLGSHRWRRNGSSGQKEIAEIFSLHLSLYEQFGRLSAHVSPAQVDHHVLRVDLAELELCPAHDHWRTGVSFLPSFTLAFFLSYLFFHEVVVCHMSFACAIKTGGRRRRNGTKKANVTSPLALLLPPAASTLRTAQREAPTTAAAAATREWRREKETGIDTHCAHQCIPGVLKFGRVAPMEA